MPRAYKLMWFLLVLPATTAVAGGPGQDYAHGTAPLSSNAVLITGSFSETSIFAPGEPTQTTLTAADGTDVFLMSYSP